MVIADIDAEAGERVAADDDADLVHRARRLAGRRRRGLVARIVGRHGRLDAVHANAGIETPPLLLADTPDECSTVRSR